MDLISNAKNVISVMAMGRLLGVSCLTSLKIKHELMQAMHERDGLYLLRGKVQNDDAYLAGELSGGKVGHG